MGWWSDIFSPEVHVRRISNLPGIGDEPKFLAGKSTVAKEVIRVLRIVVEFIRGLVAFHFKGPAITVFGSARFDEKHPYYQLARKVGHDLAREGFVVVTGGGPGIMEAANRGAKEAGGFTIGANIILPHEQDPNPYVSRAVTFYYFFVRKVLLVKYSYAFLIFPGGFGTLDEATEALTLIQTGKIYDFPVIFFGKEYWKGFTDWLNTTLVAEKTISAPDLKLITVTDDPHEALELIRGCAARLKLPVKPLTSPIAQPGLDGAEETAG
jgi:uncharacterized protein (TIGR00730 family)